MTPGERLEELQRLGGYQPPEMTQKERAKERARLERVETIRHRAQSVFTPDEWRAVAFPEKGDLITLAYGDAVDPNYPLTAQVHIEAVNGCRNEAHPGHAPARGFPTPDAIEWPHLPGAAQGGQRRDAGLTWVPGTRPEAVAAMVNAARTLFAPGKHR